MTKNETRIQLCIKTLERCDRREWRRRVRQLAGYGQEAVPRLIRALTSHRRAVTLGAARALVEIADRGGVRAALRSKALDGYFSVIVPDNGPGEGSGAAPRAPGKSRDAAGDDPFEDEGEVIDLMRIGDEPALPLDMTRGPVKKPPAKESMESPQIPFLAGKRQRAIIETMVRLLRTGIASGSGALIAIRGGEGCGKSALLERLAYHARDDLGLESVELQSMTPFRKKDDAPTLYTLDHVEGDSYMLNRLCAIARRRGGMAVFTARRDWVIPGELKRLEPYVFELPDPDRDDIEEFFSAGRVMGARLGGDTLGMIMETFDRRGGLLTFRQAQRALRDLLADAVIDGSAGNGPPAGELTVERGADEVEAALRGGEKSIEWPCLNGIESVTAELSRRVLGQERAISMIAPSLLMGAAGLSDPRGPAGVYLFYGPTGCGKSELARTVADVYYGGALHKEDMNTYYGSHTVAGIIGSPPGYRDSGRVSSFLNFIREAGRGVILFDEVEKAHPAVFDHIMEFLDTGLFRDALGNLFDGRNILVIMTSNATVSGGMTGSIGFGREGKGDDRDELARSGHFRPEFLGRVHVVARFEGLRRGIIEEIARKMYREMTDRFTLRGIAVEDDPGAPAEIADHYDERTGARSMRNYAETVLKERMVRKALERAGRGR